MRDITDYTYDEDSEVTSLQVEKYQISRNEGITDLVGSTFVCHK